MHKKTFRQQRDTTNSFTSPFLFKEFCVSHAQFLCLFDSSSFFGYSDRKNNILFNYSCINLPQAAYLRVWIRKENKQVGFIYEKEYMVSPIYFLSGNISQLA